MGIWQPSSRLNPAMAEPAPDPSASLKLLRFGVRALRIGASTVAVVALLQRQWLTGAIWSLGWLLILAAPLLWPQLEPAPATGGDSDTPGSGS